MTTAHRLTERDVAVLHSALQLYRDFCRENAADELQQELMRREFERAERDTIALDFLLGTADHIIAVNMPEES